MKLHFQFDNKELTIENFTMRNIPEVEEYFYNPNKPNNKLDVDELAKYVGIMMVCGQKQGTHYQSNFSPVIHITLN